MYVHRIDMTRVTEEKTLVCKNLVSNQVLWVFYRNSTIRIGIPKKLTIKQSSQNEKFYRKIHFAFHLIIYIIDSKPISLNS